MKQEEWSIEFMLKDLSQCQYGPMWNYSVIHVIGISNVNRQSTTVNTESSKLIQVLHKLHIQHQSYISAKR